MIPRIYIDTSVVGGCFDKEYAKESMQLWHEFNGGKKIAVASDLLLLELEEAPLRVRQLLNDLPADSVEYVSLDEEALALANAYLLDGAVAESSQSDARHIAIATVARVDVLVSWNFKHIVNLNRIRRFNAVNLKRGYPIIEIRSPSEVLNEN
ncbi:MAG: PIN domain protein [Chloroflexi bacterium]|nr:PIN domain protein [Chloroflexota bacterium]